MTNRINSSFNENLLKKRIERIPTEKIWDVFKDDLSSFEKCPPLTILSNELTKLISQQGSEEKDYYAKFMKFFRELALSARESDYLIYAQDPSSIETWISNWDQDTYFGQRHQYQVHKCIDFDDLYLEGDDGSKFSYPKKVILLVAISQKPSWVQSGFKAVEYNSTSEIVLIIRENTKIVEIRGSHDAARDLLTTAEQDQTTPLCRSESYFVGDLKENNRTLLKTVRCHIKINELKEKLNGSYTKISSPFPGSKLSYMDLKLDNLISLDEETHSVARATLEESFKDPSSGSISFSFENQKWEFNITKTGGLLFRKHLPERVITYLLCKVNEIISAS